MTHLRFCTRTEFGHPQKRMKALGITYQHCVPQSISDSWEFWNCENMPENLPPGIEIKDWDPMGRIGWGLSQEMAEEIRDYKRQPDEA